MLKIFTLKYEEKSESFNDSMLSNFLSDKEILRWESNFFERKNEYFWTVLIEYRQSAAQAEIVQKIEGSKGESYKELLKENDWPLYKVLREWRAERSKKEGIPPYIICNNMQLAKITVARPSSLNNRNNNVGFRLLSSLSCQKCAVHGWYASAWIMTRPPSCAGVCRTKRIYPPPLVE